MDLHVKVLDIFTPGMIDENEEFIDPLDPVLLGFLMKICDTSDHSHAEYLDREFIIIEKSTEENASICCEDHVWVPDYVYVAGNGYLDRESWEKQPHIFMNFGKESVISPIPEEH